MQEIPRNETKPKRKLETSRDSRTRAKKIKAVVSEGPLENDDMNNNNNNNNGDVKMEVKVIQTYFLFSFSVAYRLLVHVFM